MLNRISSLARLLTEISVRRPLATAAVGLAVTLGLAFQAAQLTSEVGYAAYFGPDDPAVDRRDLREILAAALGQNLGELGTEIARRNMDVQPTLEIRPGYRFNIAVMKDLVLSGPYQAF